MCVQWTYLAKNQNSWFYRIFYLAIGEIVWDTKVVWDTTSPDRRGGLGADYWTASVIYGGNDIENEELKLA